MKSIFASLAVAAVFASSALAQLTINTPTNPVVCQPLQITWSGGTPPYFLSILPGNQPGAQALEAFGSQNGTEYTWTVNIAVGTSIGFHIVDSTGASQDSAPFSVLTGPDTSCVNKNPTSSGGASATGTATGSGATTSTAAGAATSTRATVAATTTSPGAATTPAGTTNKPATSGASAAASSTSSKSGAISQNAQFGVAGVVGAAIVALLA